MRPKPKHPAAGAAEKPPARGFRQGRDELLAQALEKHGAPGIGLLLRLIEHEVGREDLRIDRRLAHIAELTPDDFAKVLAVAGARR